VSDCIECPNKPRRDGYVQVRRGGKRYYAHRLAWIDKNGPIPDDILVCHSCDNRRCRNTDHLFLGTHQDNSSDMVAKGRSRGTSGAGHYKTKFTQVDVDAIRVDGRSSYQVAIVYAVSPSTIRMIRTGRHWS
jgi:hypothetical protein